MTTNFQKLFHLSFQHEYFGEELPKRIFEIGPILNNSLGVQYRLTENGFFSFIQNSPKLKSEKKTEIPVPIYFPIKVIDANFYNYTQFHYNNSKVVCFSDNQIIGNPIQNVLNKSLDIQPSRFTLPLKFEDLSSIKSISLMYPDGLKQSLSLPIPPYNNGYAMNLTGELEGKYQLCIEFNKKKKDILYDFFVSNYIYNKSVSFVFEYKINIYEYVTNLKSRPYECLFDARLIYWRYIFIGFEQKDWDSVKISPVEVSDKPIFFKKVKERILLDNGQFAFEALSTLPLPFQYRPKWRIRLSSNRVSEGTLLPYPHLKNLTLLNSIQHTIKQPQSEFFANIFCYF